MGEGSRTERSIDRERENLPHLHRPSSDDVNDDVDLSRLRSNLEPVSSGGVPNVKSD